MTATDHFQSFTRKPAGGPRYLVDVTPSDSQDLAAVSQWLYVGTGGNLRVTTAGGSTVTLMSVMPGWHALEVARVHATGTTASHILAGQ